MSFKNPKSIRLIGIFASIPLLATSQLASADTFLGLYAIATYWSASLDGDLGNSDSNGFFKSFSGDSGDRDEHAVLSASFEHGLPLLPNVWIRKNNLEYTNSKSLTSDVNIGSASFDTAAPVEYNFDFSHTDVALYYELLDNWFTLDVGLGAKSVQFDYSITQGAERFDFDESSTIPMLFGRVAFELPFSGWQVTGQTMALSFEDDRVEDVSLELGYNLNSMFQVALGYRQINIDIDIEAVSETDITLDGSYLSFIAHL